MNLADTHHHLIYGLDDGAQTFQRTQAMLRMAHENGVSVVAATPHAFPGVEEFDTVRFKKHLKMAQKWSDEQGLGISICTGTEVFYNSTAEKELGEGKILTLNGTSNVLVEFNTDESFDRISRGVRKLGNAGYSVVLAHAERYDVLRKIDRIKELKEYLGTTIQINTNTVLSKTGFFQKRWLKKVLEKGLCDVIASDAHNTSFRSCKMKECYKLLKQEWGKQMADDLCVNNPLRLLGLDHEESQLTTVYER